MAAKWLRSITILHKITLKSALYRHICIHSNHYLYNNKFLPVTKEFVHLRKHHFCIVAPVSNTAVDKYSSEERASAITEHCINKGLIHQSDTATTDVIKFLVEKQVQRNLIINLTKRHLKFCQSVPLRKWESSLHTLWNCGFKTIEAISLLTRHPILFDTSMEVIEDIFSLLRSLGVREILIRKMCLDVPFLLTSDTETIKKNFANLAGIFTKTEAIVLVKGDPSLLVSPWNLTNEKINFLEEMGHRVESLLYANPFRFDLDHIRNRHMFLIRAGLYKIPKKTDVIDENNPTLHSIINTPDKYFSRKVGLMTLAEYEAFVKIMDLFDENVDSDLSESDSETEYD